MFALKDVLPNEEACPVDERELTQFNTQSPKDTLAIAADLPLDQRARLCHFCYSRAHLHSLAMHLASTCDLQTLVREFGTAGKIIFEQSRDADSTLAKLKKNDRDYEKKPVTLPPVGLSDEDDEDDED